MSEQFYAHSENDHGKRHALAEHLRCVGRLAADRARNAAWAAEASLAGQLHDLGKYGTLFQKRLTGAESGIDHWSAGAYVALAEYRAVAAALVIEGHHIGIQAASATAMRSRLNLINLTNNHPLKLRLSDPDFKKLCANATDDGLRFVPSQTPLIGDGGWEQAVAAMLDVRMLFSCLTDADFLDTEAHFNAGPEGKRYRPVSPGLDPSREMEILARFMDSKVRRNPLSNAKVGQVRAALWDAVTEAAQSSTGLFSLTAPTGSGKTLAMLQFALAHAARNRLRRVVLVVPYLSIIEQTARVYRDVFTDAPDNFILEHHSLAGLGKEQSQSDAEADKKKEFAEQQRRLLSQNWDAPIVITTNVQLLESLFSNRPSACRKLHNLAESVILFDEAQSIPQKLAVPTLAALSHLSVSYKTSVVFATATQPAFDTLDEAVKRYAVSGWKPKEIVSGNLEMFKSLVRVGKIEWPRDGEETDWLALAAELRDSNLSQVLCVVNLKRHAVALLDEMKGVDGAFHLSTNLCAAHRRAVLDEVRTRLNPGAPKACRLISTQCIEAGVDLDFPAVFRAMAPLEAIAQAAGRCNREGRMAGMGRVKVFQPPIEGNLRYTYPTHAYYQAAEVTRGLLRQRGDLDINDPEVFRVYYARLYDLSQPAAQFPYLDEAIKGRDFPEVASQYRLIDQDAIQVVVPWSHKIDLYKKLREQAIQGINGNWMREAQALAVSVYRPKRDHPAWGSLVAAQFRRGGDSDEWFVLEDPDLKFYDDTLGLRLPDAQQVMIS